MASAAKQPADAVTASPPIDPVSPRLGLGCMRLSTEPDRDESRGIAVIHAALDAGIRLLDTAGAYCWNDEERGHNERLIARALASWPGDRSRVRIATKGGMTRPDGRWEPDGRARSIAADCDASRRALGVERIHLYQLHAPDPRVPLATSVRALAALERDGLIESIGLSNVTVGQIEEARRIADIDSVQVELSIWNDAHFLSGVAEYCAAHCLQLLAHRPLGGPARRQRTERDPVLREIAARHEATPLEIALAWLLDLSDVIVPIPGATSVENARSIARAAAIALSDEDRQLLDRQFPAGRAFRARGQRRSPRVVTADGEVVLIMGLPGAGKSTLAADLVAQGYQRLNRDEAGGSLRSLARALDASLAGGTRRIVLDNTYVSRRSRAEVIRAASERGIAVRCIWLSTSIEEAQVNAAARLLSRYGRLPGNGELKALQKKDVAAFPPTVLFRFQRELEPPDPSEGFSAIEVVPFERRRDPSFTNRALIVWCDDVLVRSRSGRRVPQTPEDVDVAADRAVTLRRYYADGWHLLGMSWQREIAEGAQSAAGADAVLARVAGLIGVPFDVAYCPHAAGPPACWCRKPLPGLGVLVIERHKLDPAQCIYIGAGAQDPGFARRLGFEYRDAEQSFAVAPIR